MEKVVFENRTFYAKFERIDGVLDHTVISQHLDRQYTIATPLLKEGKTHYLVIEYRGVDPMRFYHTGRHLMQTLMEENFRFYQGKRKNYVQLFIEVDSLSLKDADERVRLLSAELELRLPREWKCFPDITLPECYNIVTLPYSPYPR